MLSKKRRAAAGIAVFAALAGLALYFVHPSMGKGRYAVGDTVERSLGGESYRFRCIDTNYFDELENHRPGALFLCDEVIPADLDSTYVYEETGGGRHGYVFYPGPIVRFGETNDYRDSAVRAWLLAAEEEFSDAEPVLTGVSRAFSGRTGEGSGEQFRESDLRGHYIGSQVLTDRLFILSVDEAFRYREWLWRFDGSEDENPQTQVESFAKSYWLRSPLGSVEDEGRPDGGTDSGMVYVVDLVDENIRPELIEPAASDEADTQLSAEDEELAVTGTTGVRPAFVLPQ